SLFFSSRRRHTRSKRDWSSDVCSSDLSGNFFPLFFPIFLPIFLPIFFLIFLQRPSLLSHFIHNLFLLLLRVRHILQNIPRLAVQIGRASCRAGAGLAAVGGEQHPIVAC